MTLAEFKELPNEERFKMITISKIVERADKLNLLCDDRISLMMDLEVANKKFDLRLNELLEADDFNFSHDICGIQNNIDRTTKTFMNCFVPRFAR
ncbi:hypothetical protein [uncultured Clostridium sp.]|uniref:DUF6874 family protein n=1 Tax=uncultured Clostridium sp. TaxID=59620 RepID=UPI00272D4E4A|nr:hypothetical protein [uncultured Clostridium sp.]